MAVVLCGNIAVLQFNCMVGLMPDLELRTAGEVIDAVGGTSAAARLTGKKPQHVSNWRSENRLPSVTYLVFKEILETKRLSASPLLWSIILPARKRKKKTA